ncbi:MAG: phosphoribosyltransferase family protein [Candidatus Sericytochromatia bacterium]|nr:phosphoribosyltransferase family protein [Candidatus Sericytochromatia bacterium]
MRYRTRKSAGEALAAALVGRVGPNAVVVGLPRGGLPVAAPVARRLGATLDVRVVRKIGLPWAPEVALGAVASTGDTVWNAPLEPEVPAPERERLRQAAWAAAQEREAYIRALLPPTVLTGRPVVVVDDGVATGMTMRAALACVRREHPARLLVAAPVMAPGVPAELGRHADEVVALAVPAGFTAVGAHYDDFPQLTDAEVRAVLASWQPGSTAG